MHRKGNESLRQRLLSNENVRSKIAERAYKIFEEGGRVHGHDKEDWHRAETEILSELIGRDESALQVQFETGKIEAGDKLRTSSKKAVKVRGIRTARVKTAVKGRAKKAPGLKSKAAVAGEPNRASLGASDEPGPEARKKSSASPRNRKKGVNTDTATLL